MKMHDVNFGPRVGRLALNCGAPALLVGMLLTSQSFGVVYPGGAAGKLERRIDAILATEQKDITRQRQLLATQNTITNNIASLEQQLANTTNPNQRARLERQIANQETRLRSNQATVTANSVLLQRDLNVLVPQKDQYMTTLGALPRPARQIQMFLTAATQRETSYTATIQKLLAAHPVTPVNPF